QYRAKCVACHSAVAAAAHPAIDSSDCAPCHMPRRRTEDAVHVIMTDHRITRKPVVRVPAKPMAERDANYRGPLVIYYPENLPEQERDVYLGAALITASADRQAGIALLE